MLVSFCVIAYNEEKAIKSLFSDIKAQDYPHEKMEVILVNAMSTDKTRELMEKFAEENKDFRRVCVLDNQKKIQAAGWNVAIKASAGDIIMRIDAHTMIPNDFVSKNVECIIGGEDVSGGPRPNIAEDDTPWRHTLLLAESSMFGSSIAHRREVFDKAGMFDERLGRTEDNEMHYRIRKAGYRICYNPEIVSYQNIRNSWGEMLKQKYGNGYWIGLTLGICFRCFSFYHFVPLLFVLALIGTGVLAAFGFIFPIVTLGTVYILINLLMSILAIKGQKKYWQYFLLPVIFSSLHIAYGFGTLVGIIKMPFWRKRGKKNDDKITSLEE